MDSANQFDGKVGRYGTWETWEGMREYWEDRTRIYREQPLPMVLLIGLKKVRKPGSEGIDWGTV